MSRFVVRASAALALLLLPAVAGAQTSSPAAGAPATLVPTATTRALADTLLHSMNLDAVMRAAMMAGFDATLQQQPQMQAFRPVMEAWGTKHLNLAAVAPELVQLYAETYTEAELKAFLAFYRSPAGRRLAATTPEITRRSSMLGASVAMKHQAELQQMMQAKMMELQSAPVAPTKN